MKGLILFLSILFLSFNSFSQCTNTHPTSSPTMLEIFRGTVRADSGFVNTHFIDTLTASKGCLDNHAGIQITVGDSNILYIRNFTHTQWIKVGGFTIPTLNQVVRAGNDLDNSINTTESVDIGDLNGDYGGSIFGIGYQIEGQDQYAFIKAENVKIWQLFDGGFINKTTAGDTLMRLYGNSDGSSASLFGKVRFPRYQNNVSEDSVAVFTTNGTLIQKKLTGLNEDLNTVLGNGSSIEDSYTVTGADHDFGFNVDKFNVQASQETTFDGVNLFRVNYDSVRFNAQDVDFNLTGNFKIKSGYVNIELNGDDGIGLNVDGGATEFNVNKNAGINMTSSNGSNIELFHSDEAAVTVSNFNSDSSTILNITGERGYLNFGGLVGQVGYGHRDSAGVMQFKDNGGQWSSFYNLNQNISNTDLSADGNHTINGNGTEFGFNSYSVLSLTTVPDAAKIASIGIDSSGVVRIGGDSTVSIQTPLLQTNGAVKLTSLSSGATTDSLVTWNATTKLLNRIDASSLTFDSTYIYDSVAQVSSNLRAKISAWGIDSVLAVKQGLSEDRKVYGDFHGLQFNNLSRLNIKDTTTDFDHFYYAYDLASTTFNLGNSTSNNYIETYSGVDDSTANFRVKSPFGNDLFTLLYRNFGNDLKVHAVNGDGIFEVYSDTTDANVNLSLTTNVTANTFLRIDNRRTENSRFRFYNTNGDLITSFIAKDSSGQLNPNIVFTKDKLGIGTASPTESLQVETGNIKITNGGLILPTYTAIDISGGDYSATTAGIYQVSVGSLTNAFILPDATVLNGQTITIINASAVITPVTGGTLVTALPATAVVIYSAIDGNWYGK